MPSFAESLEKTLHQALHNAADRRHEYATLEHLLLALIDDADAAQVMQACGVDLGELGDAVTHYLDNELDSLKVAEKTDPAPTSGFQRVVQRAIQTHSTFPCSHVPRTLPLTLPNPQRVPRTLPLLAALICSVAMSHSVASER